MTGLPPAWRFAALFAAAATLALLVHLVIVLLAPVVASRGAYARLEPLGAVNATVLLPRAAPDQRLAPYADPAVATAICRFDLASGPIRVSAPTGRAFASVSFHTTEGLAFYALTDKSAAHGAIEVVLATPEDIRALEAKDDEENPSRDLRVAAPAPEGYVLMRVLSEEPGLLAAAEDQAKRLICKAEPVSR